MHLSHPHAAAAASPSAASCAADSTSPSPGSLVPAVRSSVRVSSEVHGFVLWMGSFVALAVWIAWATLPERLLTEWGITYYPDRWWSVALPGYFLLLALFVPLVYLGVNLAHTLPPDDLRTIRDGHTIAQQRKKEKARSENGSEGEAGRVSEIADIPLERLNELLYRKRWVTV